MVPMVYRDASRISAVFGFFFGFTSSLEEVDWMEWKRQVEEVLDDFVAEMPEAKVDEVKSSTQSKGTEKTRSKGLEKERQIDTGLKVT